MRRSRPSGEMRGAARGRTAAPGPGAVLESQTVATRRTPLSRRLRPRGQERGGSRFCLAQPETLTSRLFDPLDQILTGFDRAGAIDESPDHFRLRNLALARPASQPHSAFKRLGALSVLGVLLLLF